MNKKDYWGKVYSSKAYAEASWYQPDSKTSLGLIDKLKLSSDAAILDVGGGDSHLVDHLINRGFKDISVLDISGKALEKARQRLGAVGKNITWLEADVAEFNPTKKYDFWHDRAVFHFLTERNPINHYLKIVAENVKPNGYFLLATFSDCGPLTCSGLDISRYSLEEHTQLFAPHFEVIDSFNEDHKTPSGGVQNFSFTLFRRV